MLPVKSVVGRALGFGDPFGEIRKMHDEMDQLFTSLWRSDGEKPAYPMEWVPSVDMFEGDKEIVVKAELPGILKEDLSLTLKEDVLTIRGERKQESEKKPDHYFVREGAYGSFYRVLLLPYEVQADQTTAVFENGILEITLPKAEAAKTHDVKIEVK